jgi:2-keto-4-pentenoate hydratase
MPAEMPRPAPALHATPEPLLAALREQRARRRELLEQGARHVGWKIGAGISEIDAFTGGSPALGYLTSATVFDDGAELETVSGRELHAETELLIQVARTGAEPCAVVGVAIELVDVARPPCEMRAIVARNVFHRAAVLGRARAGGLPAAACARLWIDGELREIAPVTTDVAATIAHVAGLLAAVGERLRAGDVILGGSLTHVPVHIGSAVAAEIDGAGRVEATLARTARRQRSAGSLPGAMPRAARG